MLTASLKVMDSGGGGAVNSNSTIAYVMVKHNLNNFGRRYWRSVHMIDRLTTAIPIVVLLIFYFHLSCYNLPYNAAMATTP
ncbi:MAG: hypothetical protein M3044_00815 [Thermoproteota archaeon]|nr:hypothetical protein [Thermoproteota archaeon]